MLFFILLALICVRPFLSSLAFPFLNLAYSALLFILILCWVLYKKIHWDEVKPLRYPLILLALAFFISTVFSIHKTTSIRELHECASGILLFLIAVSLSREERGKILLGIVITGVLVSITAAYQYFFGFRHLALYLLQHGIRDSFALDYISSKRVFFPFVTPNILGGYLAMVIPLTLVYKKKLWLLLPLSLALLLTKSLGAFISLFLGLVIYFCLKGNFGKKKIALLLGLLVILGAAFLVRMGTDKQHLQPVFSTFARLNYWHDSFKIIQSHFFTGVGIGNFDLAESRYAHNSYLQMWAEWGLLGIISFLLLVAAVMKSSLKMLKGSTNNPQTIALLTATIVFLIHNFVDFPFFLPEVSLIYWLILGLLFSSRETA